MTKPKDTQIWAQLDLSEESSEAIERLFVDKVGVDPSFVTRRMHLTVYHADRFLPGAREVDERVNISIAPTETRFMVMVRGGENPLAGVDPAAKKVGIRIQRRSPAMSKILDYRQSLVRLESKRLLRGRVPSSGRRSAFGAKHFQPHMTILQPGSGIGKDLKPVGELFRRELGELIFDRYRVFVDSDL